MNRSRVFARGAGVGLAAAVGLMLQGCVPQQTVGPAASGTREYQVDQQGAARVCTATTRPSLTDGKEAAATMTVGNDGGWCALSVARDGQPYGAGLLAVRPAHGSLLIHTVGDDTRIDYTPNTGYVGPDTFTARLLPGNATLRVAVTVTR